MAEAFIDIKEDAAPTKKLASQTHTHGVDTVHSEEINIVDAAGNLVNVTANRLLVDGSGVTQPVSDAGSSLTVDALDLDIRNLVAATDKVGATVDGPLGGGTEAGALRVTVATDSTGVLSVDDNGGILTVDGTVTANQGGAPWAVQGNVAHDAAVSTNQPVAAAGVAETAEDSDANTSANRVSADADIVRLLADRYGALFVREGSPFQFSFTNKSAAQQTNTAIHAAPAAGLSIYITDIYFAANGAVNVTVETATPTTLWAYYASGAGDGASCGFRIPIKLAAATALQYDTSAAIEHTLVVTGYIAP